MRPLSGKSDRPRSGKLILPKIKKNTKMQKLEKKRHFGTGLLS